jgi:CheY-like chemotaxis protein
VGGPRSSLLRLLAVGVAEDAGFETIEASNADEAIRILESRKDVRIVFTDIEMPGSMDGLKLAACIRDRWPPVELILTSGQLVARRLHFPRGACSFRNPTTLVPWVKLCDVW